MNECSNSKCDASVRTALSGLTDKGLCYACLTTGDGEG
jgi:hypothetical protein